MPEAFPAWTVLPFVALVLSIAIMPLAIPGAWGKAWFQGAVVAACASPAVMFLLSGHHEHLRSAGVSYLSFVLTIGALYVTSSGIFLAGDIEATPRTNAAFIFVGALLASLIGTTGASILLIRPLLRTNSERTERAHLVPFFIVVVSNAGGLLTPLGDPPLLIGYLQGVPFLWTLRLLPYWILYVVAVTGAAYLADQKAYAREPAEALRLDREQIEPLSLHGKRNFAFLAAIAGFVLLPSGVRELGMMGAAVASYLSTPARVHEQNGFSFTPIVELAVIFAGLFACLAPIEVNLARSASSLPLQHSWQLFWGAGILSSVLDNAPTYAAFAALARGLNSSQTDLVSGMTQVQLTAISVGSVVMGATTYIGNGPNLIVRALAEQAGFKTPNFGRYALFAGGLLFPLHLVTTAALVWLERVR
jgi:Na+/H+ antiporter NhaD/arsenite permease-like protein